MPSSNTSRQKLILLKFCLILVLLPFLKSPVNAQRTNEQEAFIQSLNLSAKEKQWLDHNYVVRVHPDTWPPFNYWDIKTGTNQGICVDYLRWIEEKTGIIFEYPSMWMPLKHILPALKYKQLDMSPSLQKTHEREKYLLYSESIFLESLGVFGKVIPANKEELFQNSNIRISCEESSKTHLLLKERYPNLKIIPTITEENGLRKVISNEADYHAGATSTCKYLIKNYYGLHDLKLVQKLCDKEHGIFFAVRDDWRELQHILTLSLSKMPAPLRQEIVDSYLNKPDWNKYKDYLLCAMAFLVLILSVIALLLRRSMRKQKEQRTKLEQDDLKLQQASEMAGLHFMEFLPGKQLLYLSSKSANFFTGSFANTSLSYRQCLRMIFPEDFTHIKHSLRSLDVIKGDSVKFRIIQPSGKTIHLSCFVNQYSSHDKKEPHILISCLDITELKKTELLLEEAKNQAEKANKAKSLFLARMSHEIRTPLNVIIGMLNLTFKTQLTSKQHNYLKKSLTASEILLSLINDILDFSKIEANKTTLHHSHFNLHTCLDEINNIMSEKASEKNLSIDFNLSHDTPQWILADELRLKQVLINLIGNAIKFTDKGNISIETTQLKVPGKEIALQFRVSDTGIGIAQDKLPSLFQSFMQLDDSFVRRFEGTGLGLAISKKIVSLWNGQIWVESQPGSGSSFYFTFYAKRGKKTTIISDEDNEEQRMIKTPRILLAEDNLFNQEIAREIITEMGANIEIVDDGIKAFKSAITGNFDIVLMDINMPVADGITATRLIRKKIPVEQLPIIAVTAYALMENMQMCLDAGMNDFISKPYKPKDISRILQANLPDFYSNEVQKNGAGEIMLNICTETQNLKIIDSQAAEQFFPDNPAKLRQYLLLFMDNSRKRLPELKQFIEKSETEELKRLAHAIKGEAGYLGLEKLHFICEKVDTQTSTDNQKEMGILLSDTINTTLSFLNNYLQQDEV